MPKRKSFLEKKRVDEEGLLFTAWFARNIDHKILENLKIRCESEHQLEPYSRRHAVMNILGFIYHKCHDRSSPQEMFKQVLEDDQTNLNALLNLAYVHECAGQKSDSLKYIRQYHRLLQLDEKHQKVIYARHLYEISVFMLSREENFINKYYKEIVKHLQLAIDLGKAYVMNEVAIWKFALGSTYMRIDSVLAQRENIESKWMKSALKNLYEVAIYPLDPNQLSETCYHYPLHEALYDTKGKAWAYMGTVLWRRYTKKRFTLSNFIDRETLQAKHKQFDALKCFDTAQSIAPTTPTVLRRIGQAYTDDKKLRGTAYELLKGAKKAEPIGYSYSLLGQWYLKQYEDDRNRHDYLQQAIKKFRKAVEKHCDMFVLFKCLAKAYEYNGEVDKALNVFASCESTHEGPRTAELYTLWADLLDKNNHHESAEKKRILAAETRKGQNPKQMRDFGVLYNEKDRKAVTKFVEKAESKFSVNGYFIDRDLIPGHDVLKGLTQMQEKCRLIIVFVTENFNKSEKNEGDLSQIISARERGNTIVPLLAKNGKLPKSLCYIHPIEYNKSNSFWEKLGQVLQKGRSRRFAMIRDILSSTRKRWIFVKVFLFFLALYVVYVLGNIEGRVSCSNGHNLFPELYSNLSM